MSKDKVKTVFFCTECGYESPKWMGQCPGCKAWNTFKEGLDNKQSVKGSPSTKRSTSEKTVIIPVSKVEIKKEDKIKTNIGELDRVLGGGIVWGSLTLIGGDPGIGKSTLLLQVCKSLGDSGKNILYVSGEESAAQIKLRADRIGEFKENVKLYCETCLDDIKEVIEENKPEVVVIDSIQTMFLEDVASAPGSVSQVREATGVLMRLAKGLGVSIFIVGHVTKDGNVAGPKMLEHMVDTVLYFEGDRHASYRILRGVKNRFGSTNEIGVFEMRNQGLVEVANPSEFMLSGRPVGSSGNVVSCSMEGTRPIFIEIQALITTTNFGIPRRQSDGVDLNRVNLLMAVLEKKMGLPFGNCDAYINVAGGIKVSEPAVDLGLVVAILSSFHNKPVKEDIAVFGEVGLSGEVRAIAQAEARVSEAKKLGFKKCILPASCKKSVQDVSGMELTYIENIKELKI
ncbi:DNA repair protein RadA/Sms [Lachnospiraceae bacterium G41]|nr:DNA repair protein RadA/Sms [Lachnospiraceae bacterium G41]